MKPAGITPKSHGAIGTFCQQGGENPEGQGPPNSVSGRGPAAPRGEGVAGISDPLAGALPTVVIPAEAHGQQVLLGELPIGVEQFRMDGETTGAVGA